LKATKQTRAALGGNSKDGEKKEHCLEGWASAIRLLGSSRKKKAKNFPERRGERLAFEFERNKNAACMYKRGDTRKEESSRVSFAENGREGTIFTGEERSKKREKKRNLGKKREKLGCSKKKGKGKSRDTLQKDHTPLKMAGGRGRQFKRKRLGREEKINIGGTGACLPHLKEGGEQIRGKKKALN